LLYTAYEGQTGFYVDSSHPHQVKPVIKNISKITDLPVKTLQVYRGYDWTDEEIVENLNDAIALLNSHLHFDGSFAEIPVSFIFQDHC